MSEFHNFNKNVGFIFLIRFLSNQGKSLCFSSPSPPLPQKASGTLSKYEKPWKFENYFSFPVIFYN